MMTSVLLGLLGLRLRRVPSLMHSRWLGTARFRTVLLGGPRVREVQRFFDPGGRDGVRFFFFAMLL